MNEPLFPIGAGLILLAAILFIRELRPGLRTAVSAAGGTLLFVYALGQTLPVLSPVIVEIREGVPGGDGLFRCLGVSLATGVFAALCRDAGEEYLARSAEAAGRCAVLLFSLPLMKELLGAVGDCLK